MVSYVAKTGRRIWTSESVRSLLSESNTSDPVEAMRAKAAALIELCEFDGPPINHEMVASFRSIVDVNAIEMRESGALVPIGGGEFKVFVNQNDVRPRQRFSCKHEVSHTLFPNYMANPTKKTDLYVGEYQEDAEEEYLCDVGAAELLMPRRFFHPALRDMGCSIEVIVELAGLYEASREAVAVQLAKAAVHDCAIIVWYPGHTKDQADALKGGQGFLDGMEDLTGAPKELRTKYAIATSGIAHHFPKNKSVPDNSPIQHCYLTGEVCKGETWFPIGKTFKRFHTESMYIPVSTSDGSIEGKVITLVLPGRS
ncbi:MAG: hypothetical protein JWL77_2135 [Chthonomonadaceae bacterium]|nr:hypothetical protein [Chthonomonadaceae bacterium]